MIPTHIVVHCSDLPFGTAEGIDRFHRETNGWTKIGYHYVIENGLQHVSNTSAKPSRDGVIRVGRLENESGAHAKGMNDCAIGVCLVGRDAFSPSQLATLYTLLMQLCYRWQIPVDYVIGHNETPYEQNRPEHERKTCPNLNMKVVRDKLGLIMPFFNMNMMKNGEHSCG